MNRAVRLLGACLLAPAAAFADGIPLFGAGQTMTFDHLCSETRQATPASHGAYALFEAPEALALGELRVGFIRGASGVEGFGLGLLNLDAGPFSGWAGEGAALALEAGRAGSEETARGDWAPAFLESEPGAPPSAKPFAVDAGGRMAWENFAEPDRGGDASRAYRFLERLDLDAARLPDPSARYIVSLLIRNERSGEIVRLTGPQVTAPAPLELDQPEFRRLGLLATLNPFEEGGLVRWVRDGFRYRSCIDVRRAARAEFAARRAGR